MRSDQRTEIGEESPRLKRGLLQRKKKAKQPGTAATPKTSMGEFFRNRIVIGFICITVALLIAFVGFPIAQAIVSERVPVVKAADNIKHGTLITQELVVVSEMAAIDRPANAAVSIDQVVGTYASIDILGEDILTSRKLAKEPPLSNPYLYGLPEGKLAMSVTVKGLAEGLTGKLKAGDIVTVYAILNNENGENDYAAMQPPELRYVRVLASSNAVGSDIDVDTHTLSDEEREKLPATLTLLVGDLQAAALAGLDSNATIHVGLVARGDAVEQSNAYLALQEEYIAVQEEDRVAEISAAAQDAPPPIEDMDASEPEHILPSPEQREEASNG